MGLGLGTTGKSISSSLLISYFTDLENPYVYASNNPTTLTDPYGEAITVAAIIATCVSPTPAGATCRAFIGCLAAGITGSIRGAIQGLIAGGIDWCADVGCGGLCSCILAAPQAALVPGSIVVTIVKAIVPDSLEGFLVGEFWGAGCGKVCSDVLCKKECPEE